MATDVNSNPNGVNVEQLVQTVNAVKENPDLAKFRFRAVTEWVAGGRSRTTIKDFYGAGQEDTSRERAFVIDGDEPPVLLGNNHAPNSVETILQALASCLAVGFSYNAAVQGIKVRSLRFDLEGELDLHGFLGLSEKVRPGYNNIRVKYTIDSDAPADKIEELCEYVQKTSPVMDILTNPVSVSVSRAS